MDGKSSMNVPHPLPPTSRMAAAKSLLAKSLSQAKEPSPVKRVYKGKTPAAKKAKVKVVPQASTTLKTDLLARFTSQKKHLKPAVKVAPKTKVVAASLTKATSSSRVLQPPAKVLAPINPQDSDSDEDLELSPSQLASLRRKLASGHLKLREYLQLGTDQNSTVEKSQTESEGLIDCNDIQDDPQGDLQEDLQNDQHNSDNEMDFCDTQLISDPDITEKVDLTHEEKPSSSPNPASNNAKESVEQNIVVIDGSFNLDGVRVNLQELQNVLHLENCCPPCRQTTILIVEKLNIVIQELTAISKELRAVRNAQSGQTVSVPIVGRFRPDMYPLMPKFTLKTEAELISFNELLKPKKEDSETATAAGDQFMALISSLGGLTPAKEVRNILGKIIDNRLAADCTWIADKFKPNGEPRLKVGEFWLFKIISAVVISNWEGVKDKQGNKITVDSESVDEVMQNWFRRSTTRIKRLEEKASVKKQATQ
ncbi:hypothetical protein QAD02_018624 [Eretmocerus hayati]|uniref:Uncharacterized protein n=2 Tax=Eretmocerus hayati TaxID=131215 RepID=A0ACC2PIH8_9HYME|nr:hypothetical protein QAD02_018623 [Eretmocerus hayati]KAJ8682832.1 hypothetical protein QAD02_018624 [Eretmocerus hayati]